MKIKIAANLVFVCIMLLCLTACGGQPDEGQSEQQDSENISYESLIERDIEEPAPGGGQAEFHGPEPPRPERIPREQRIMRDRAEIVPVGHLQGEIRILGTEFRESDIRRYARLFNELHPEVDFIFERYEWVSDMTQLVALSTRLMADPPDILVFNPSSVNFDKMNLNFLFVDLYDFFYGPRGIDQNDYFYGIFHGAEVQGGLFHLPFNIDMNFAFLNRRLFEGIGVNVDEISRLTIDDELNYFFQILDAFPDEDLLINFNFSIAQVFLRDSLYCVDTGLVFANTSVNRRRLTRAMEAYRPTHGVVFGPDEMGWRTTSHAPQSYFFNRGRLAANVMYHQSFQSGVINSAAIALLQDFPDYPFSGPVMLAHGDGYDYGFTADRAFSIARNSTNQELAWEFIRFMMEFEESKYRPGPRDYYGLWFLPINRNRFENQFGDTMYHAYNGIAEVSQLYLHANMTLDEHREHTLNEVMSFYRSAMERLNYEIRVNWIVFNSLLYPDIWLLYSGQQDVARTLANIQNRLELYVAE